MKTLILLNDPPYGTERSYNGFRLAWELTKRPESEVRIFLMGDAVACAHANQKTPAGYYNLERMVRGVLQRKGRITTCGTCLDARGLSDSNLIEGVTRGSMEELADWHCWADKVATF